MEMNQQDINEIMEAYLLDNLPPAEKQSFEERIRKDEELAQALSQLQLEHRAMQLLQRDALRTDMNAWKAEKKAATTAAATQAPPAHKARRVLLSATWTRWAAAASVLLLIGFVAQWVMTRANVSNETLAAEFYVSPSPGMHRGDSEQDNAAYIEAATLLQQGKYDLAVEKLSSISDPKLAVPARLQMVDAYYKKADFGNAEKTARQIIGQTEDRLIRENAEWMLVTILLASDQHNDEFKRLIERIATDNNHGYQAKAEALLKKL